MTMALLAGVGLTARRASRLMHTHVTANFPPNAARYWIAEGDD
ncbi:hypothetical protein CPT_Pagan_003 [Xanthomonas phage Pagan]|uniref:Uncharacterized protein n=1 Tax=Xanthomonas phage Pagan TaxID=2591104 RepID=A0A5B9NAH5_9CAUD|nr:hypothetical protein CPT_Pagan_003 [Xanthomonas phage Pagan]